LTDWHTVARMVAASLNFAAEYRCFWGIVGWRLWIFPMVAGSPCSAVI
jgi:hypothetical protein